MSARLWVGSVDSAVIRSAVFVPFLALRAVWTAAHNVTLSECSFVVDVITRHTNTQTHYPFFYSRPFLGLPEMKSGLPDENLCGLLCSRFLDAVYPPGHRTNCIKITEVHTVRPRYILYVYII